MKVKEFFHKNFLFLFAVGSIATTFTACNNDNEDQPVVNVPQLTGEITFDRNNIGVGQPVGISFKIPPKPEEVDLWKPNFAVEPNENVTTPVKIQQTDNLLKTTYCFNAAGTYIVSAIVDYKFTYPDADGKNTRQDTVSNTVKVIPCDIRNSFWGETKDETKLNLLGKTPEEETDILLTYGGKDIKTSFAGTIFVSSSQSGVVYEYQDGKLSEVSEIEKYTQSTAVPARLMGQIYKNVLKAGGTEDSEKRFWFTENEDRCQTLFDEWLKTSDLEPLKEMDEIFMQNKGAVVNFTFKLGNSNLLFVFNNVPETKQSSVLFTYTPFQ